MEDLEKEDNVSGEDGGKVGERRWNSGMDIHAILSLSNMKKTFNSKINVTQLRLLGYVLSGLTAEMA